MPQLKISCLRREDIPPVVVTMIKDKIFKVKISLDESKNKDSKGKQDIMPGELTESSLKKKTAQWTGSKPIEPKVNQHGSEPTKTWIQKNPVTGKDVRRESRTLMERRESAGFQGCEMHNPTGYDKDSLRHNKVTSMPATEVNSPDFARVVNEAVNAALRNFIPTLSQLAERHGPSQKPINPTQPTQNGPALLFPANTSPATARAPEPCETAAQERAGEKKGSNDLEISEGDKQDDDEEDPIPTQQSANASKATAAIQVEANIGGMGRDDGLEIDASSYSTTDIRDATDRHPIAPANYDEEAELEKWRRLSTGYLGYDPYEEVQPSASEQVDYEDSRHSIEEEGEILPSTEDGRLVVTETQDLDQQIQPFPQLVRDRDTNQRSCRDAILISTRKSERQLRRSQGRRVRASEMIEAAVRAKMPTSTTEGMKLKFTLLDFIPDAVLLHLSTVCGVSLGNNKEEKIHNIVKLRSWERERTIKCKDSLTRGIDDNQICYP